MYCFKIARILLVLSLVTVVPLKIRGEGDNLSGLGHGHASGTDGPAHGAESEDTTGDALSSETKGVIVFCAYVMIATLMFVGVVIFFWGVLCGDLDREDSDREVLLQEGRARFRRRGSGAVEIEMASLPPTPLPELDSVSMDEQYAFEERLPVPSTTAIPEENEDEYEYEEEDQGEEDMDLDESFVNPYGPAAILGFETTDEDEEEEEMNEQDRLIESIFGPY